MQFLRKFSSVCLTATLFTLVGCGTSPAPETVSAPSADGKAFVLATEPAAPKNIKDARADAQIERC